MMVCKLVCARCILPHKDVSVNLFLWFAEVVYCEFASFSWLVTLKYIFLNISVLVLVDSEVIITTVEEGVLQQNSILAITAATATHTLDPPAQPSSATNAAPSIHCQRQSSAASVESGGCEKGSRRGEHCWGIYHLPDKFAVGSFFM